MACINVRTGDGRIIFYKLDGCGNVVKGAKNKLVLDTVAEVTWEDTISDGTEVTEKNFAGVQVYSNTGADSISNTAISITHDGLNPSLDAFLMGSTAKTRSSVDVGYGRTNLTSSAAVAVEVLLKLDADACTGGATAAPILGLFFPFVKGWKPNGGATLNGNDLLKPQYTGKGYRNANIFTGSVTDTNFSKWSTGPIHVPTLGAAQEWYTVYSFDGATYGSLPSASCEPVALA